MMSSLVVEIGGYPVRLSSADSGLLESICARYAGFVTDTPATVPLNMTIQVVGEPIPGTEAVRVTRSGGCWRFDRQAFHAEWFPAGGRGSIRQVQVDVRANSTDSVLRILHTLLLAPQGGFLLHASSAVRNGSAFAFSGVSGAGKTPSSAWLRPTSRRSPTRSPIFAPRGTATRLSARRSPAIWAGMEPISPPR